MPAKNSRKEYLENSYYHIYNRGVEKRKIFIDEQDYGVFLGYLKEYLTDKDMDVLQEILQKEDPKEKEEALRLIRMNNFCNEIDLIAYCLMSNHFHLLIKQKNIGSMDKFMNSIGTRYTMYFNKKYKGVGKLYQGVYKAVLLRSEEQFLYLTKYIHQQAISLEGVASQGDALMNQPCSFMEYVGKRKTKWIKPQEVLLFFNKAKPSLSYKEFVFEETDRDIIKDVIMEYN